MSIFDFREFTRVLRENCGQGSGVFGSKLCCRWSRSSLSDAQFPEGTLKGYVWEFTLKIQFFWCLAQKTENWDKLEIGNNLTRKICKSDLKSFANFVYTTNFFRARQCFFLPGHLSRDWDLMTEPPRASKLPNYHTPHSICELFWEQFIPKTVRFGVCGFWVDMCSVLLCLSLCWKSRSLCFCRCFF